MNPPAPSRQIGRKIWYATAITLSGLIILLGSAGIIGNWIIQNTLSKASVNLFDAVYTSAGGLRQVVQRIDQAAGEARQISSEVSQVSLQISQNVEDKGLLPLLLPEDKEDQLAERINSIHETLETIHEILAAGFDIYRTIDTLPFVSLPALSEEQLQEIEAVITQSQADIIALRQSIQDFRSGVATRISRVTQAADKVTGGMDELSSRMEDLDASLVALQEFAVQMQTTMPRVLTVLAILLTLCFVYVIYTQVEVIRIYTQRWKLLRLSQPAPVEPVSAEAG